ncbi:MAG: hypothetical protein NZ841_08390, partial [Dictyoglomus sp.]|nr:hypothetical protein [Dictyoglomus sp.]MDW8189301.1 hypothetical protein [Dictyoglomus sp.]
METKEIIGISKYSSFGLRKEWLNDFLNKGDDFFDNNSLGPKQLLALRFYLKDTEILEKNRSKNRLNFFFYNLLISLLNRNSYLVWCILWCNLVYNSNLFKWWSNFSKGVYKKSQIDTFLGDFYGKLNRSIKNASCSLVGTFERTPIGNELKQGIVKKEGRERIVIKEGDPELDPIVVLYNLYKFAERNDIYEFSIYEIENRPLSPQKVFCTDSKYIEKLVIPYAYQNV